MARHIRRDADIGLAAISVEGALISPEQLSEIASTPPDQKAADDYGCPRGLSLRDEITRYFRIGQAHWQDYARLDQPNIIQTVAFARKLLKDVFGFDDLSGPVVHQLEGHTYRISLEARDGRVPIVVAAPLPDPKADAFGKALPEMGDDPGGSIARRSPATLLQSWLNAKPEFLWGLVFAGDRVRLMRDNASFTRAAHIEADLGAIFRDEMFADFTAIWFLIHASRFGAAGAAATDSALERWREAGQKAGTAARERLRGNVEEALLALGQGLVDTNPELARRMADDSGVLTSVYEQMLRVVYRLIFLAVAEARDLLHPHDASTQARALYADSYGFSHLRDRSTRRAAHDHHYDAWEGARIVLRALEQGERTLALPGLGGLFASGQTPDLDSARLANRAFLTAVFRLSWLIEDGRRVRINWRDMATEELGSVYEGLLELVPQLVEGGQVFAFAGGDEARGNARKVSGSYYTPDSLVQALLDTALTPVLERAEREGGAEAILKLNVIDPACGSGHFLLGAARRMATRVAQLRNPDAPDYQAAMRDVVRLCIHGVDRNPMAVELAKVALWIEAIEPGKPLGFLDANIRCGDSLFGVFNLNSVELGIPDVAYKPLSGDDKEAAKIAARINRQQRENPAQLDLVARLSASDLARAADRVHVMPENTLAEMAAKASAFERLRGDQRWAAHKLACDLYVASFLRKKEFREGFSTSRQLDRIPTTHDVRTALAGGRPEVELTQYTVELAEEARAFHWPLEYPEVFSRGGFDLVIGNPPWERVKLQEKEFFAQRAPEIAAAANKAERQRLIDALGAAPAGSPQRRLSDDFERAKRSAEAASEFARVSDEVGGRFPLTGTGDVNTYALFAELFAMLARETGRAGVILPTGIATDATTAPFFASLVAGMRIASLVDFENRERIFPGVYYRVKFCLLTLGRNVSEAKFGFFLTDVGQLQDERRVFRLAAHHLAAMNPNTKTAPVFRSSEDARVSAKIYDHVPVLVDDNDGLEGGAWGVKFARMFDMANDSHLFRTSAQLERNGYTRVGMDWFEGGSKYVPFYEAKMMFLYNHRHGDFALAKAREDADYREIPSPSLENLEQPNFEVTPRYWVPQSEVSERLLAKGWEREWLIGWRDITNATNERTLVASVLPRVGCSDKILLMLPSFSPRLCAALLGNMSSIVADYVSRQKVGGTSFKYFTMKQIALLPPSAYSAQDLDYIVERVIELAYTSSSIAPFARDVGYGGEPFKWDETRRAVLRAELDAWYARAYGLVKEDLRYILDPTDVMGDEYPSETFRVLKEREIRNFGEFRTKRLVLEAWDRQDHSSPSPDVEISALPDGVWTSPVGIALVDVVPLQIAAILKGVAPSLPEMDVRMAALLALEPRLLTARLERAQAREWVRLIGRDAEPLSGAVLPFAPRVANAWGQALTQLRASKVLIHDEAARSWSPGPGLARLRIPAWAEGRANFILPLLAELKQPPVFAALPAADQAWIRGYAAA